MNIFVDQAMHNKHTIFSRNEKKNKQAKYLLPF